MDTTIHNHLATWVHRQFYNRPDEEWIFIKMALYADVHPEVVNMEWWTVYDRMAANGGFSL